VTDSSTSTAVRHSTLNHASSQNTHTHAFSQHTQTCCITALRTQTCYITSFSAILQLTCCNSTHQCRAMATSPEANQHVSHITDCTLPPVKP
jgi:hypothetical protein